jgi:hypothetical protein
MAAAHIHVWTGAWRWVLFGTPQTCRTCGEHPWKQEGP